MQAQVKRYWTKIFPKERTLYHEEVDLARFNRFRAVFDIQCNRILQQNHKQPTCRVHNIHKYRSNKYPETGEAVGKMRIAVTLCFSQKA